MQNIRDHYAMVACLVCMFLFRLPLVNLAERGLVARLQLYVLQGKGLGDGET